MADPDLAALVDAPDEEFRAGLGAALSAYDDEDAVAELLVLDRTVFARLVGRMADLPDVAAFAAADPDAVEAYLRLLWTGIELVTDDIGAVADAVTMDVAVEWRATDSSVVFHAVADAGAGTVSGGPGPQADPDLVFEGPTDVLFSMLGDRSFDARAAYERDRYAVDGSLERAREFEAMMTDVTGAMRALV